MEVATSQPFERFWADGEGAEDVWYEHGDHPRSKPLKISGT
jgi:hypothetical protein